MDDTPKIDVNVKYKSVKKIRLHKTALFSSFQTGIFRNKNSIFYKKSNVLIYINFAIENLPELKMCIIRIIRMLRSYYNNYIIYFIYILTISYDNNEMNITIYFLQLFYLFFIISLQNLLNYISKFFQNRLVFFKSTQLFHIFTSKLHISIYFHKILSLLKLKFLQVTKKDEKIIKESSVINVPQFILNKHNITLIVIILIELLILLSCLDLSQEMTCI